MSNDKIKTLLIQKAMGGSSIVIMNKEETSNADNVEPDYEEQGRQLANLLYDNVAWPVMKGLRKQLKKRRKLMKRNRW